MSAPDLPESAHAAAGFAAMGLHEALLAGIRAHGLSAPRVFQQQVITALIELHDDMVVQAPFLSGKTIAVCIGLLQRCDFSGKGLQALVICPTRELTHLTFDTINSLGKHLANDQPFCIQLDGEGNSWQQRTALKSSNTVIAVGTPGRIASLWSAVPTNSLETVVFDDAEDLIELDERIKRDKEKRMKQQQRTTQQSNAVDDEDKNDGEKEEAFDFGIDIAAKLPPTTQRVVCFAVKTEGVRKLTETLRATEVVAPSPGPPFTAVKHLYVKVSDQEAKLAMVAKLCAVISAPTVVYVDRPRKAVALTNWLMEAMKVSSFHGGLPRDDREHNLAAFRSGSTRVLVATDMVNYGEHGAVCVINSDLPWQGAKYARRLCRPYGNYRPMVMISLVRDVDVRWFDKNREVVGSENVVEVEEPHFEAFFRAMPILQGGVEEPPSDAA